MVPCVLVSPATGTWQLATDRHVAILGSGSWVLLSLATANWQLEANMKIVFFGDSITRGSPGASYLDILMEELPEETIENQGRGGETAASLQKRIRWVSWDEPFDLAFVWVGVNDLIFKVDWSSPKQDALKEPWPEMIHDFRDYFHLMLLDASAISTRVVAVAPLFLGENYGSVHNQRLQELGKSIEEVAQEFENVEYLDLRDTFVSELQAKNISAAPAGSAEEATGDRKPDSRVDDKNGSWQGELYFTVDGVHLSEVGAQIVADVFVEKIICVAAELGL